MNISHNTPRMERPNWDQYFMNITREVAARATCPRASVGAVVVKDNRILSTGYNGAPPGKPHCIDIGCQIVDDHCDRTIHAETNAVTQAARFGTSLDGATMYMWANIDVPICNKCMQVVEAAGIINIRVIAGKRNYESVL